MKDIMRYFLLLSILIITFSCINQDSDLGSSKSDSEKNPDSYLPDGPVIFQADYIVNPFQPTSIPGAAAVISGVLPPSPRYEIVSGPSWLSVNLTTGELSLEEGSYPATSFKLRAYENGNTSNSIESSFKTIAQNGDPLRYQQWHIKNSGLIKTYALRDGDSGIDINSSNVYKSGFTGDGVKVAVSDSGGEINHDDFVGNIISGAHRDYTLSSPYTGTPTATNAHGTAVGGIIAARGWNNKGGIGVAPFARLAFFQFLSSAQTSSILIHQASGDFDIFNYSYGDTLLFDTLPDDNYIDHLRYQTQTGRKFFVKAAGNEYTLSSNNICAPHNANAPFENESPFMLVIGAFDAKGEKAQYSNTGSNIWVSAPGGDYGSTDPAILTTDLPTCLKGFSKSSSFQTNDFEYNHPENTKCNYTSVMNGTSAAAPMVSGVIALILEANPTLSHRDVKHILAMSSKKIDPNHDSVFGTDHPSTSFVGCTDLSLAGHNYELGWVENDADVWFNNFYGFGSVDAEAAVSLAQDFNQPAVDTLGWLPLPALVETNPNFSNATYDSAAISLAIPDNSSSGVSHTNTISYSGNLNVETIMVNVQVSHPKSGQLGIELTSPAGTKSILLNINNSFLLDNDSNLNITLSSHAFYGETLNGNWTIKVIDGQSGSTGTLTRWKMNILGH
jgi:subtilisin family serine protease